MDAKNLELIKVVNDNYDHIQQLETLAGLLKENYLEEHVVAETTINSHYKYRLVGQKKFQHPENHIETFFVGKSTINKSLITAMDDNEIFYPPKANVEQDYKDKTSIKKAALIIEKAKEVNYGNGKRLK